ncbi:MAG: hypothetical protein GYB66_03805 [Chloroflexi bacterium]|nr:hypothetical protein [Chloroflexota bacterium]
MMTNAEDDPAAPANAGSEPDRSRALAPFGLRLGLMWTFMLLGVAPLIKVYVSFRLNAGEDDISWYVPFDFWMQALGIASIAALVSTVIAWRGRPGRIYWVFQLILVLTMVIISVETAVRYYGDCPECLVDQDILNPVFRILYPFQLFTTVYMLWYINREPARIFYGYSSSTSQET